MELRERSLSVETNSMCSRTSTRKKGLKCKVGMGGSKWGFFKNMDALLNMRTRGHSGLGCGVDLGEYVFMNPRVCLDRSNVLDEMRDSLGQSDEDNKDGLGGEEKDGESTSGVNSEVGRDI